MSQDQFQEFYQKIYQDRWQELSQSLLKPEVQMARWNQWAGNSEIELQNYKSKKSWNGFLQGIILDPEEKMVPQITKEDLLNFYVMDPASAFAAKALDVQDGDRVLDMCAAPGGKSLILIEALKNSGEIICNDISSDRRERLKKVIQNYVPRTTRDRVWVKGLDAVQYGLREPESFDRILLDAPCSGERHFLNDKKSMQEWSVKRPKGLEQRQYALFSAAFLALKPEGAMVYSTCSLNPNENDGVVGRLLKKKKDAVSVVEVNGEQLPGSEKTDYGIIYLPDRCGFGPLYISRLIKHKAN